MGRAAYTKILCFYCDQVISYAGLASVSHARKHVREGLLCEVPGLYGRREFEATEAGRKRGSELFRLRHPALESEEADA